MIRQLIFELDDDVHQMKWKNLNQFSKLELAGIAIHLDELARGQFWPEENDVETKPEESPNANQS